MTTEPLAMPLDTGADGVVRIAGTHVTLDTVVLAFQEGASAEEIAHWFCTHLAFTGTEARGPTARSDPEVEPKHLRVSI